MVVVAAMFTAGEEAASLLADDSRPIADYGAQSPAAAPSHARTRRYAAGALCALAVVALAGARDAPAPARAQTAFAARPALAWEAANEYTARLGAIAREYPWQGADFQVVDCLKPFSLALTVDHRAQETVAWSLEAPDREVSTYYGPRAEGLVLDAVGDYALRVTSVSVDGVVAASGGGTVAVRYVRRELRDLSEADRTTWLDALALMWTVDGDEGRKKYDARFVSSDELLALHATNSALRDNDHFHNGAGFLAQHLRLDEMVLDSLQSVDASISTPYWDWTIESKLVEDRVISSPLDTPLWTADWFGSLNYAEAPVVVGPHYGLSTDEFFRRGFEAWAIRDGRWAYATVKRYDDVSGVSYPLNSYGFLRSPWNNNPSPYVTRVNFKYDADDVDAGLSPAKSWPTCTNLYDFLLPNATAVDFMTHLEDMTVHANVHQVLGGTILDVESTQAMLDAYDAVGSSAASCYQTVAERQKRAPASKQRVKDGSQVLELKVQETSGDALCYPDGATLFPALLQAKAGFHTGGKPWGGMLLTDRGQYGGLHSDHLDPTFTYDHLAALRPAVDGYDEMRDACAAGGDCAYHFKKTCTYEDAAMRGKDLAYSGVFSCSEACVVDRFYSIDDPALDLGPDERRSCAQPVLATLFNTPDLFKSCLTPDYDYTRGGAASGADGCHECIDACVDAYPGALTLSADSDAGCPASPGAYAALALEPRQA